MKLKLNKLNSWTGRKGPLLLVILDGIGIAPAGEANAVSLANTPCLDRLFRDCPVQTQLKAHGPAVGLPSWDDMGNSEVGHNALGAGRIFDQGAKLVNRAIDSGELFKTPLWQEIIAKGRSGATVHLIGLLSDGNVHSHIEHLFALLRHAAASDCKRLVVHALLDGRDVDPKSALKYLDKTEAVLAELRRAHGCEAMIASGGGRMRVTMDRYNADWRIVERGWQAHVHGIGRHFTSARQAVETFYAEDPKVTSDQNLDPFVIVGSNGAPLAPIRSGDAVVFFNFRGDRAIEISRAFEEGESFKEFDRGARPNVLFAGMMRYDGDLDVPKRFLVQPPQLEQPLSEYLCAAGLTSFAVSETQKYGHVTYFWNGNRSGYVDQKLERYVEIPSDRVPFNEAPRMKAAEITATTVELLDSRRYQFGRINYPNGDMVGHTGDIAATVKAVEAVDRGLERLIAAVDVLNGVTVVLADHGNADEMFTVKNGERIMKTSHTLNPVPFFICDSQYRGEYRIAKVEGAGLANVAATLLNLLGYEKPADYEPSLIEFVQS